jgi:hypothetical protein
MDPRPSLEGLQIGHRLSNQSVTNNQNQRRKQMKKISQTELKKYRTLENEITALQVDLGDLKQDFIDRLDQGVGVEGGDHTAELKTIERRSVSWKQVVVRLKSLGYVKQVLASTKPSFFFKLTVR